MRLKKETTTTITNKQQTTTVGKYNSCLCFCLCFCLCLFMFVYVCLCFVEIKFIQYNTYILIHTKHRGFFFAFFPVKILFLVDFRTKVYFFIQCRDFQSF